MAKNRKAKQIADEEKDLDEFIAAEQNDNIVVLKIGSEEFNKIVNDWKSRLHITKAFMENNSKSFDYRLIRYSGAIYKEEAEVRRYLDEASDYTVNVLGCDYNDGPEFVVRLLNPSLLNMEMYQKIRSMFDIIIVDYKKSKFDCIFTHEQELWIIKFK